LLMCSLTLSKVPSFLVLGAAKALQEADYDVTIFARTLIDRLEIKRLSAIVNK